MLSGMVSIYALHDEEDGRGAVYVGQTGDLKARTSAHLASAKSGGEGRRVKWLRSLRRPTVATLEIVSPAMANEAERFWIASLRALGLCVINFQRGGGVRRASPPRLHPLAVVLTDQEMKALTATAARWRVSRLQVLRWFLNDLHADPESWRPSVCAASWTGQ